MSLTFFNTILLKFREVEIIGFAHPILNSLWDRTERETWTDRFEIFKGSTLGSGIVVLVGIIVYVGTFTRIKKRTGGNKSAGVPFFWSV